MKQRITVEQLEGLNSEQQKKLIEWWQPKKGDFYIDYEWNMKHIVSSYDDEMIVDMFEELNIKKICLPLLSIGQCIEFLIGISESICLETTDYDFTESKVGTCIEDLLNNNLIGCEYELIDALWEAIKESL